ncbi:hypothetical protein [Pelomonas sp. Root1237]|uniref:hypothetical protein n=1 Tax=Pelomonas sp. Root1237 TaxID=1736434 RepID=UPI0012F95912|nr:hypothetical protein [Pelomonas sp. Root1237]
MKQSKATLLAFVSATALIPTYLSLEFPLSGQRDLLSVIGTFVVFGPFTAMVTCVIAVPAYAALSKFGWVTWWSSVGSGVLTAVLATAVLMPTTEAEGFLRFALLGGAAGFVFWLIWRMGRE